MNQPTQYAFYLTLHMENGLEIRKSRNVLQYTVTSWQEEVVNLNPEFIPTDENKESIAVAKLWKDKIFTAQIECENVPDTQDLRTDASTASTGFLAFITAAFKEVALETHAECYATFSLCSVFHRPRMP